MDSLKEIRASDNKYAYQQSSTASLIRVIRIRILVTVIAYRLFIEI